jgi:hypothetical protein
MQCGTWNSCECVRPNCRKVVKDGGVIDLNEDLLPMEYQKERAVRKAHNGAASRSQSWGWTVGRGRGRGGGSTTPQPELPQKNLDYIARELSSSEDGHSDYEPPSSSGIDK